MLSSQQTARRFFNVTIEMLEADRCASEGTHSAMTSTFMMANHAFILSVIVASTVLTVFAVRMLWHHNVFTNCTKVLLLSALFVGLLHQWTMAVIRLRAISHVLLYSHDPCSIQFHVSNCFVEIMFYYMTNLFTTCCLISLFLDRLFSLNLKSRYHNHQHLAAVFYIVFQLVAPSIVMFWVFYGVPFAGYVPVCNYPPAMSLSKFYWINEWRMYTLLTVFVGSLMVLMLNKVREKKIIHNVYDTDSRYKSYESLLTTGAVCIIITTQVVCLVSTSGGTALLHKLEPEMSEAAHHSLIAFMAGLTYSNFFLPIVIYYSSRNIISHRHNTIGRMKKTSGKEGFDEHFATLDINWS